jgi:hypothetical protein
MADPTDGFFDGLGRGRRHPQLIRFSGTVSFDLESAERVDHWLVTVTHGDVQVSRETGPADMGVAGDRATFNQVLIAGGAEVFAMYVRHKLKITGNPRMLFVLRILADSRTGRHPRSIVTTGGK